MLEVDVKSADFVAVSRALKREAPHLRKALFKEIRSACRPLVVDLRQAIKAVGTEVTSQSSSRAAYRLGKRRGLDGYGLRVAAGKELGRSGLRDSIARSVRIVVKDSGYSSQVGVKVKADTSYLPADQRKLPRYIDRGEWRHPVYGNTNAWVSQTTTPNWFTGTTQKHRAEIVRKVGVAVEQAAQHIARSA